jgi:hypothetical protein
MRMRSIRSQNHHEKTNPADVAAARLVPAIVVPLPPSAMSPVGRMVEPSPTEPPPAGLVPEFPEPRAEPRFSVEAPSTSPGLLVVVVVTEPPPIEPLLPPEDEPPILPLPEEPPLVLLPPETVPVMVEPPLLSPPPKVPLTCEPELGAVLPPESCPVTSEACASDGPKAYTLASAKMSANKALVFIRDYGSVCTP